jgi:NADH:ubiquinone oxidoreductase subunit 5 (subunit L)/multisubunit Na+/H+ antiporter MnhA subunit
MFLLSFLLIPIVAAILLLFIQQEKRAQNIAIVASVLSLAAAVNMLFINVSTVDLTWLQVLNSRFVLQADGLAKILILLME